MENKLRAEFEQIINDRAYKHRVNEDDNYKVVIELDEAVNALMSVHAKQQEVIDGLSGVIESQKQTMEAMGKRLLMIEQVISGSSNPLTIRIGNILNPTAESSFNQPRFYTEADMLAMGERVRQAAIQDARLETVCKDHKCSGCKGECVMPVTRIYAPSIQNINLPQILKTINDGKQQ